MTAATEPRASAFRERTHLDAVRRIQIRAHLERLFDDAFDEGFRFRWVSRAAGLYCAEQRRLKRRLVLFQVERHLLVSHALPERTDKEPEDGSRQGDGQCHASQQDRAG